MVTMLPPLEHRRPRQTAVAGMYPMQPSKARTARAMSPETERTTRVLKKPRAKPPPQLSTMDQRILVLFNSKLQRMNQDLYRRQFTQETRPPAEMHHAAIVLQRLYRGHRDRTMVFAFFGPRNQQKALLIQRIYRGHRGRCRAKAAWARFWFLHAQRLQAWIRGFLARDHVERLLVTRVVAAAALLQRVYRGYGGRCVTHRMRHAYHTMCAVKLQRVYRGHRGRCIVATIRYENATNARAIALASAVHNMTHTSLLMCLFARLLGLFDLRGAKVLCLDGFQRFPTEPLYLFAYSLLLQLQGDSLEVAMVYLHKAKALGLSDAHRHHCETKYFYAALQWRPGDATICLSFAIALQCFGLVRRADALYKQALQSNVHAYNIRGYLARRAFSDVILLNWKRYLCVFKLPLNLRVRLVHKPLLLHGTDERIGVTVFRHNHYAVITPDVAHKCNSIYLADDEIAYLVKQVSDEVGRDTDTPPSAKGRCKTLLALQRRRTGAAVSLKEAAGNHDLKSNVRLSMDHAERIVALVVFLPLAVPSSANALLMVIPALLRWREHQARVLKQYEALLTIQRVFRGYLVRFQDARRRLLSHLTQQQMHRLGLTLQQRKFIQERRGNAATRIQAAFRGYCTRCDMRANAAAATVIQSLWRRELAKRRVIAIREGNLNLFPVTRVFHRGLELGGRSLLVAIDQSGLSFRFYGTDYNSCTVFTGCCPRSRTMQLLRYVRYEYATAAIGQSVFVRGSFGAIESVDTTSVAHDVAVVCRLGEPAAGTCVLSLLDAAMAIRTAQAAKRSKSPKANGAPPALYPLPLDAKDIPGIVRVLVTYLALVPTMSVPTRQLQRETNTVSIAVVLPANGPHLFLPSILPQTVPRRLRNRLPPMLLRQSPKPYQTTLRVDSSLQTHSRYRHVPRTPYVTDETLDQVTTTGLFEGAVYRQQCPRHFQTLARCKCFLLRVDSSAASHLASLDMALSQGRGDDDRSRLNILTNAIPNRSGRMWLRPKPAVRKGSAS
ncbi:hypothetical protein SPRG_05515 [Saprolegnia parasitica CBS 223.65]|uniref:Uncharacterized protein n=1 Tax=Saprolegnia parasitica (strain CBS 223.65) TaxID=695850 RepID=A0A067CFN0_SAPPC|nr:hypothetical protein SPRG_05515 [Saprolegnia parasitica CBS 223.65]KDO29559.1 hypothetical protein SPRG_05515 [Saprolegnia parasitica CBS 223.65]|eukprot:XP_012199624.1 hypothetical protein SPRG_05515 [Saprolegnia parasitica CBS 223.65]